MGYLSVVPLPGRIGCCGTHWDQHDAPVGLSAIYERVISVVPHYITYDVCDDKPGYKGVVEDGYATWRVFYRTPRRCFCSPGGIAPACVSRRRSRLWHKHNRAGVLSDPVTFFCLLCFWRIYGTRPCVIAADVSLLWSAPHPWGRHCGRPGPLSTGAVVSPEDTKAGFLPIRNFAVTRAWREWQ